MEDRQSNEIPDIIDPGWFGWSYTGVNFDLAGNGGDECQGFLSVQQRIIESVVTSIISGIVVVITLFRLTLPNITVKPNRDYCGKRILLVIMCLTFGIELGFKFATQQMIYLLNPCHIATMMQVCTVYIISTEHKYGIVLYIC